MHSDSHAWYLNSFGWSEANTNDLVFNLLFEGLHFYFRIFAGIQQSVYWSQAVLQGKWIEVCFCCPLERHSEMCYVPQSSVKMCQLSTHWITMDSTVSLSSTVLNTVFARFTFPSDNVWLWLKLENWIIVQMNDWFDSFDWLTFQIRCRSTVLSIGWPLDWWIVWFISQLSDRLIDWLIDWLIDSINDWHIDWLIFWLIDQKIKTWLVVWLVGGLVDWLIDWLIDWVIY